MEASSSTSQTLRGLTGIWSMEWQQDSEDGPTGPAFELDESVVPADQVLRNRKTEPGAVRAPRYERIEQCVPQLIWNSRTVVLELHARDQSMTTRADVDVRERTRTQRELACVR